MIKPPKNHRIWVQYPNEKGLYIISSSENDTTKYFLYQQVSGSWVKIAQSSNPMKLEEKVFKK